MQDFPHSATIPLPIQDIRKFGSRKRGELIREYINLNFYALPLSRSKGISFMPQLLTKVNVKNQYRTDPDP